MATEWLHSVPPLITDNESSIQEECENLFLELVLERVSTVGCEMDTDSVLPECVLSLLKEICNGEVAPWVKKICTNMGKKNRLKHKFAIALQNIIRTSESLWLSQSMPIEKWTAPPGSWFLLSEVSAYLAKAVDWEFLHHHWQLFDKNGVGGEIQSPLPQGYAHEEGGGIESNSVSWAGDRVFLLQTISNVSVELPPELAADIAQNLLERIEKFNMHSTEVLILWFQHIFHIKLVFSSSMLPGLVLWFAFSMPGRMKFANARTEHALIKLDLSVERDEHAEIALI